MSSDRLVEHFFRHEYGRLVARLTRRFGVHQLELAEDSAQTALLAAVKAWPREGPPDALSAWAYRVALNHALGTLRQDRRRERLLESEPAAIVAATDSEPVGQVDDDLLRMLFACCDERIPFDSQQVLALKTLCGFSTAEIAARLTLSEANVHKRLGRARERLRQADFSLPDSFTPAEIARKRPAVHQVLYVLFAEGHLSSHPEYAIRRELCAEAIRLATLMAERDAAPASCALVALMHLHAARMSSRIDARIGLLLLEEQDRAGWDARQIQLGLSWLATAAQGNEFSRYHAEAGIAAEHCLAPDLASTRWEKIVEYYALLERVAPSPLHALGRAIAIAEWQGPRAGLDMLAAVGAPTWATERYEWSAVLADLYRRCGDGVAAHRHAAAAIATAPSEAVRILLRRRLNGREVAHPLTRHPAPRA